MCRLAPAFAVHFGTNIEPLPGNRFITSISQIVETESRESVKLLRFDIERADDFIRICNMCKKIAASEIEWRKVEDAVQILKLFEKDPLPQFTHGICEHCYNAVMVELER